MPSHYVLEVMLCVSRFLQATSSFIDKVLCCFEEFPFRVAMDVADHCFGLHASNWYVNWFRVNHWNWLYNFQRLRRYIRRIVIPTLIRHIRLILIRLYLRRHIARMRMRHWNMCVHRLNHLHRLMRLYHGNCRVSWQLRRDHRNNWPRWVQRSVVLSGCISFQNFLGF